MGIKKELKKLSISDLKVILDDAHDCMTNSYFSNKQKAYYVKIVTHCETAIKKRVRKIWPEGDIWEM